MKLRGSALDGWLCAAQCGPFLAGGDGGAKVATASEVVYECDHTFLNINMANASVDEVSEIMGHVTCGRVERASKPGSWLTGDVSNKIPPQLPTLESEDQKKRLETL